MHYYKSTELADLYSISRRTVTNWIKQAQEGKLELELVNLNDVQFIAKSELNQIKIRTLVQDRRKYLNKKSMGSTSPLPSFYETYSDSQIHDIIRNLSTNRELPLQYSYFNKGAELWNAFRSEKQRPFDAERLIQASMSYIEHAVERYEKVNIVDVGVGNGMAARDLIEQFHNTGKLKRYIGIDISPTMLDITSKNIKEWFNDSVPVETHIRDISCETFADVIAEPPDQKTQKQSTVNIVLSLGGYISNFRNPEDMLRTINRSMGPDDIYLCNFRLNTNTVKHQVGFISKYHEQIKTVLDSIGIDESQYDVEIGFSEEENIRFARIRLKRTLQIEFKLKEGSWFVELSKDETILTYRASFNDTFESPKKLFYDNGFNPLMTTQLLSHESMFVLCDLRQ